MPPAKCACAASSLMLAKGNTTTEPASTAGEPGAAAVPAGGLPGSRTTSKLHASSSATGKPRIRSTVVKVSVQGGSCSAGTTTEATWTSSQPTTPYAAATRTTLRFFSSASQDMDAKNRAILEVGH